MKCNKCGQEFGKGDTCQHCGADKVAALGEFSGYSTPKTKQTTVKDSISSPSSQHIEPITSQICWKCGEIIPLGKFCPACGQLLIHECPKCKTVYSAQYNICPNCGTNITSYTQEQELVSFEKKKKEISFPEHIDPYNLSVFSKSCKKVYDSSVKLQRSAGSHIYGCTFYFEGFPLTGFILGGMDYEVSLERGKIRMIFTKYDDDNHSLAIDYHLDDCLNPIRGNKCPPKETYFGPLKYLIKTGRLSYTDYPISAVESGLSRIAIINNEEIKF